MPFGLRLSLWLLIAACAEPALVVPDSDWRTVPAAQREAVDKKHEAEVAAARAELAAASANLAAFRTQPATPRPAQPRTPPAARPDPDDIWATVAHDQEKARAEALARVEAAIAEMQRADLAWRRLRVDAANARIAMLGSQREVIRAQAIDHNLPGNDHYDVAPLRGQFSRVQQRWYMISSKARAEHDAFERAAATLASAKEAYAQVMRGGPMHLPESVVAADDHTVRRELPGWSIARSDIRRRRGLRHFLEETRATPQLRRLTIQLNPALHAAPAVLAASPPAASSPAAPNTNSTPGNPPRGNARPAPPAPERSADRAASAPPPAAAQVANKPAAAARNTAPAAPPAPDHPADRAGSTAQPAAASPNRPAEPARAGSAAPTTARPNERAASSPSSTAAPASAGKPVQRPISETDAHAR